MAALHLPPACQFAPEAPPFKPTWPFTTDQAHARCQLCKAETRNRLAQWPCTVGGKSPLWSHKPHGRQHLKPSSSTCWDGELLEHILLCLLRAPGKDSKFRSSEAQNACRLHSCLPACCLESWLHLRAGLHSLAQEVVVVVQQRSHCCGQRSRLDAHHAAPIGCDPLYHLQHACPSSAEHSMEFGSLADMSEACSMRCSRLIPASCQAGFSQACIPACIQLRSCNPIRSPLAPLQPH